MLEYDSAALPIDRTERRTVCHRVSRDDLLEFFLEDDELMADIDEIVYMDARSCAAALSGAVARSHVDNLEALAEQALQVVYRRVLELAAAARSGSVGAVLGGRSDVCRMLLDAIDDVIAVQPETTPTEPSAR